MYECLCMCAHVHIKYILFIIHICLGFAYGYVLYSACVTLF